MDKKNALKELVKKLKADVGIVRAFKKDLGDKEDEVGGMMIDDIDKASRIVAELANVEDQRNGETNSDVLWRCNDCIAKCRTIAEEGAEEMRSENEPVKQVIADFKKTIRMKNFEKYKTAEDRVYAFREFCNPIVRSCQKACKMSNADKFGGVDPMKCFSNWLELEAEDEKLLPCPFCGDKGMVDLVKLNNPRESFVRCARCFYSSPRCDCSDEAVAAHNRLCRAVMAAKESEARDGE